MNDLIFQKYSDNVQWVECTARSSFVYLTPWMAHWTVFWRFLVWHQTFQNERDKFYHDHKPIFHRQSWFQNYFLKKKDFLLLNKKPFPSFNYYIYIYLLIIITLAKKKIFCVSLLLQQIIIYPLEYERLLLWVKPLKCLLFATTSFIEEAKKECDYGFRNAIMCFTCFYFYILSTTQTQKYFRCIHLTLLEAPIFPLVFPQLSKVSILHSSSNRFTTFFSFAIYRHEVNDALYYFVCLFKKEKEKKRFKSYWS